MMDFLCSALIGMSSEPRIHITDQHCYEFWIIKVISNSFLWTQNGLLTYICTTTNEKKSRLGLRRNSN